MKVPPGLGSGGGAEQVISGSILEASFCPKRPWSCHLGSGREGCGMDCPGSQPLPRQSQQCSLEAADTALLAASCTTDLFQLVPRPHLPCRVQFLILSAHIGHLLCVRPWAGCGEHWGDPDAASSQAAGRYSPEHCSPSLAMWPEACLPGACPTPVQLTEDHSPVRLDILSFGGPLMPQDRTEFCGSCTSHHPRPLHQNPGQESGSGRCSPTGAGMWVCVIPQNNSSRQALLR